MNRLKELIVRSLLGKEYIIVKNNNKSLRFNTLADVDIDNESRRVGNTTRQIDGAIQALFSGKIVEVVAHYKPSLMSNNILLGQIIRRMQMEHKYDSLVSKGYIVLDRERCIIKLSNEFFNKLDKSKCTTNYSK